MRPTPIPDHEVWEGAVRRVIAPPGGDLTHPTIAPVEVLVDQASIGPRMSARCELEGTDLEVLRNGGVVWVSFYGTHLHPFSVAVAGAVSAGHPSLRVDVNLEDPTVPNFQAYVTGVDEARCGLFIRGCIEALEEMLARDGG